MIRKKPERYERARMRDDARQLQHPGSRLAFVMPRSPIVHRLSNVLLLILPCRLRFFVLARHLRLDLELDLNYLGAAVRDCAAAR